MTCLFPFPGRYKYSNSEYISTVLNIQYTNPQLGSTQNIGKLTNFFTIYKGPIRARITLKENMLQFERNKSLVRLNDLKTEVLCQY